MNSFPLTEVKTSALNQVAFMAHHCFSQPGIVRGKSVIKCFLGKGAMCLFDL